MGLPTFARAYLKQKYAKCFSYTPIGTPEIIIYDLMKDVKYMPPNVNTVEDVIQYLVAKIRSYLQQPGVQVIIVLVDRKPLVVKRLITHAKRYKNKDVYEAKNAPYLPEENNGKIPEGDWIKFAGNYKLLQRELYPRLFNAFMNDNYINPRPGQSIILNGFPGYCEYVHIHSKFKSYLPTDAYGRSEMVHLWNTGRELPITKQMEQDDPDLYNRVFIIENVPPCAELPHGLMRKQEWKDAKNDISEADASMFFFDHWFQQRTIMFVCNDGDAFSYGLLYSMERINSANTFRNVHYLCLPYKTTTDREIFANNKLPDYEYLDFNLFYISVTEDYAMNTAGVQNNVATLVFLLILAESDFFKDYAKGIGKESIIWSVFRHNLGMFSHMVQLSKRLTPDTRTPRRFIIDEDAFRLFIHYCYLQKHGMKKGKQISNFQTLTENCNNLKNAESDSEYKFPSRNKIRLWARKIEYNLHLYKNAPLGTAFSPNPFEMFENVPYYPYTKDGLIDLVSPKRPPIDEVYEQHFIKNKKPKKSIVVSDETKQKIIDQFSKKRKIKK